DRHVAEGHAGAAKNGGRRDDVGGGRGGEVGSADGNEGTGLDVGGSVARVHDAARAGGDGGAGIGAGRGERDDAESGERDGVGRRARGVHHHLVWIGIEARGAEHVDLRVL